MNLISNALDALIDLNSHPELLQQRDQFLLKDEVGAKQGNVRTKSEITWQPQVMLTSAIAEIDNRRWLSIKVADNGLGIPKKFKIASLIISLPPKGKAKALV